MRIRIRSFIEEDEQSEDKTKKSQDIHLLPADSEAKSSKLREGNVIKTSQKLEGKSEVIENSVVEKTENDNSKVKEIVE